MTGTDDGLELGFDGLTCGEETDGEDLPGDLNRSISSMTL